MKKLSENEKKNNEINRETKRFMANVEKFLKSKNNGEIPPEWHCSLMLLETYYKQFIAISKEIDNMGTMVVESRYGLVPSPLLTCRDKAAMRLEAMMKELALTFKSSVKLEVTEPVFEENPLVKFAKGKIEQRSI